MHRDLFPAIVVNTLIWKAKSRLNKGEEGGPELELTKTITVWKQTASCPGVNIPADDDAVVKQVDLDVLDSNGLVEALRDQPPQQPPQVWSVVQ